MTPTHEELARALKVEKLCNAAERAGFDADDVHQVHNSDGHGEAFWENLAKLAQVNPPSETTQAAVIEEMRRREARVIEHPDPFEGLPGVEPRGGHVSIVEMAKDKVFEMKATGYRAPSSGR